VRQAFDEDGTPSESRTRDRATKFLDELEWYGYALRAARTKPCERAACDGQEQVAKSAG
jgi:hypothetical protein